MNQSSWPGWSCRLEHEQKSAMLDIVRWNIYFWKFRHVSWISKHSFHQGTDKLYWLQFWEFLGLEISFWLWSSIVNQISHQSRISWLIVEHLNASKMTADSPVTNRIRGCFISIYEIYQKSLHTFLLAHVTYAQCATVCLMMRQLNPDSHKHTRTLETHTEALGRGHRNVSSCQTRFEVLYFIKFSHMALLYEGFPTPQPCKDYQVVRPRNIHSHCLTAS